MNEELAKIQAYFAEGRRLWQSNPELVISRNFYEIWETTNTPHPFLLSEESIELADTLFPVPEHEEGDCVGYFVWDHLEQTASLVMECHHCEQRILLYFEDGEPQAVEQPLVFYEEMGLSFGERLEIMYDVVDFIRRNQPGRDLHKLSKRAFQNVLKAVGASYDRRAIAVMRGLRLPSIRKLLAKALEDMPIDEISNQLTLPLGGSYAGPDAKPARLPEADDERPPVTLDLPTRTKWQIQSDLAFIQAACLAIADLTEDCVIGFQGSQVLKTISDSRFIIRVPFAQTAALREGDRMPVFMRGERGSVGTLRIDLLEEDAILGRFYWNDIAYTDELDGSLYAKPRRGPGHYLAGLANAIVQDFRNEGTLRSVGVNAALGINRPRFQDVGQGSEATGKLDRSQQRAWSNAVHEDNSVVLIQGPPGTGKTYVLEHVLRELCRQGKRILVTAPSNTAVDNVCRRVLDLPVLRTGNDRHSIAPDIAEQAWMQNMDAVQAFAAKRKKYPKLGTIYAGTHVGILRDDIVNKDLERAGLFDVIIFDEAGMARIDEFLHCGRLANRLILFGDHQQLPPFPLPDEVREQLASQGPVPRRRWHFIDNSALQWLIEERGYPVFLLQTSYRCQNPRLMRFSSTLFYDARVKPSQDAEYYQLSFAERQQTYPATSLRIYRTSQVPLPKRRENLVMEGSKPGLENCLEARLALLALAELARRHPLGEITIIVPYRRQVKLLRDLLSLSQLRALSGHPTLTETQWEHFIHGRISTVDSFQGGESDAVIISYVRSSNGDNIGFVDDPQRINVAHTRCRKELIIIGDLQHLKQKARTPIFERMERTVARDGQIIDITPDVLSKIPDFGLA